MTDQEKTIKIALCGNPNVGKTSLFNRMTHSFEHVGNWHGVTVEKKEKSVLYSHNKITFTDLPGFYSMTVYSYEEELSRDCILYDTNDVIINVCEVNNLVRNLYLTLQLLELDVPLVVAVNMIDELKKQGKAFNNRKIEEFLCVPIVPVSAKYHSELHLLTDIALEHCKNPKNKVRLTYLDNLPLADVGAIICQNAAKCGLKQRYAAIKVLEKDRYIIDKLNLSKEQQDAIALFGDMQDTVAQLRYGYIAQITEGAVVKAVQDEHHEMAEHHRHNVPIEDIAGNEKLQGEDKHTRHHNEHSRKP